MTDDTTEEKREPDIWENDAFMSKMKKSIAKNLPAPVITKGPPVLPQKKDLNIQLQRPENRGAVDNKATVKPYELDAELAQLKMAELMIQQLPRPSNVSKAFIVRKGIFEALNDRPGQRTGYDCSLRLDLYNQFALQSVNEEGLYFEHFWAFMMKPKYIINGMQMGQEEEKQSLIGRAIGWIRGKPDNKPTNGSG